MKKDGPISQRLARYCAGVVFLAAVGVILLVGVLTGQKLNSLWTPLFWGGLASLLLGWAVGHAAGRLFWEVCEKEEKNHDHPEVVEENH